VSATARRTPTFDQEIDVTIITDATFSLTGPGTSYTWSLPPVGNEALARTSGTGIGC
jgi:hypothetical protein